MKKSVFSILLLFFSFYVWAQIGIGQWRDHLPYKTCIAVEQAGDKIYTATPYAIFYYDKTDLSVQRLSKVNGLSDVGVSQIAYNHSLQSLIIAYTNTNIDILEDGKIVNIPDINRASIIGNKRVNTIFLDQNYAYICCGFGIVVLDMIRKEIKDTYYIGENGRHINVLDLTKNDTALFAATDEGLYTANIESENLADFSNWSHQKTIPYPNAKYDLVESFANKIILNQKIEGYNTDTLWVYDGMKWFKLLDEFQLDNHSLKTTDNKLYVARNEDVLVYNERLNVQNKIWSPAGILISPRDISVDSEGNIWIADSRKGLIRTIENSAEIIEIESPDFPDVFAMDIYENDLWVVSGGHTPILNPLYNRNGFSSFKDEAWNSYHCQMGECNWPALDSIRDFVRVKINPYDPNTVYIGSLEGGVLEFVGGEMNVYEPSNSSLQSVFKDIERTIITGLQIDSENNLWVLNSGVTNILSVKKANGEWKSFNLGSSNSNIDVSQLYIDSYNQKWIIPRRSFSLIVFKDNQSVDNTGDDEVKNLNNQMGNGNLFARRFLCMTEDMDGELWFGTDQGLGLIYSPETIFEGGDFDMQRIQVQWDGYVQNLLETETITAIAVDAANRKWIGTEKSGVYLLSEDGEEQIHHFTSDNSPLLDDQIRAIKINANGEVFIGTSLGLVSFRGDAAVPRVEGSKVYAFPNPVREGYSGSIAIKNLSKDANVKIADINGNVVYETHALGGQAIWNGHNFEGEKAQTGVYLVFASNEEGSVNLVCKILFIN